MGIKGGMIMRMKNLKILKSLDERQLILRGWSLWNVLLGNLVRKGSTAIAIFTKNIYHQE